MKKTEKILLLKRVKNFIEDNSNSFGGSSAHLK